MFTDKLKTIVKTCATVTLIISATSFAYPYSNDLIDNNEEFTEQVAEIVTDNQWHKFQQLVDSGFDVNTVWTKKAHLLSLPFKIIIINLPVN